MTEARTQFWTINGMSDTQSRSLDPGWVTRAEYDALTAYAGESAAILRDARDCLFDNNWDRIAVRHLVARIDAALVHLSIPSAPTHPAGTLQPDPNGDGMRLVGGPDEPKAVLGVGNESKGQDWVAEARARYPLGGNTSYPSRLAAEQVRRFIHDLADAYERLMLLYQATCSAYHREKLGNCPTCPWPSACTPAYCKAQFPEKWVPVEGSER